MILETARFYYNGSNRMKLLRMNFQCNTISNAHFLVFFFCRCRSYNYNALSMTCELNGSGLDAISHVTSAEDWEWNWF